MSLNGILQDLGVVGGASSAGASPVKLTINTKTPTVAGKVYKLSAVGELISYADTLNQQLLLGGVYSTLGAYVAANQVQIRPLDVPGYFMVSYWTSTGGTYAMWFEVMKLNADGTYSKVSSANFPTPNNGYPVDPRLFKNGYYSAANSIFSFAYMTNNSYSQNPPNLWAILLTVSNTTFAITATYNASLQTQNNPVWNTAGYYYAFTMGRSYENLPSGQACFSWGRTYYYYDGSSLSVQNTYVLCYVFTYNSVSNISLFGQSYTGTEYNVPPGMTAFPNPYEMCSNATHIYMLSSHSSGVKGLYYCTTSVSNAPTLMSSTLLPAGSSNTNLIRLGGVTSEYFLLVWSMTVSTVTSTWGKIVRLVGTSLTSIGTDVKLADNCYPQALACFTAPGTGDTRAMISLLNYGTKTYYSLAVIERSGTTAVLVSNTPTIDPYTGSSVNYLGVFYASDNKGYAFNYARSTSMETGTTGLIAGQTTNVLGDTSYITPNTPALALNVALVDTPALVQLLIKGAVLKASGLTGGAYYDIDATGTLVTSPSSSKLLAISTTELLVLDNFT